MTSRDHAARSEESGRFVGHSFSEIPTASWLFIALAVGMVVQSGYLDLSGGTSPDVFLRFLLFRIADAILVLVPAAILINPNWRADRTIVVGAVLWMVPLAVISLFWPLVPADRSDTLAGSLGLLSEVARIAGSLGMILVGVGLAGRRLRATTWPAAFTWTLAAVCAVAFVHQLSDVQTTASAMSLGFDPVVQSATIGGHGPLVYAQLYLTVLRPIGLVAIAVIAWLAVSAVHAGEPPTRFWRPLAAGALLLAAVTAYELLVGVVVGVARLPSLSTLLEGEVGQWGDALVAVAGGALIVVAFLRPGSSSAPNQGIGTGGSGRETALSGGPRAAS